MSTDTDSSKFGRISARPGANGRSIKIIDPLIWKVKGYYHLNVSKQVRDRAFDVKETYSQAFIIRIRNENKIFDVPLPRLAREVREIGNYAGRCGRIPDSTDVLQKERRRNSALLGRIVRFKGELRDWAGDGVAGVMADAARITGAVEPDVQQPGRGDAYYKELFRLLDVAEEGLKRIQTPSASAVWVLRLQSIVDIKKLFRRQSERVTSIMACIPSPGLPSPDHFSYPIDDRHLHGDPYDQLLRLIESLEASVALVIQQGKPSSSGGPRIDWGLEALTRRAFEFWEKRGEKVTVDPNRDGIGTKMVWFVQALAEPLQITSDARKIISAIQTERRKRGQTSARHAAAPQGS